MTGRRLLSPAVLLIAAVLIIHGTALAQDDLKIQSGSMVIDEPSGNIKFHGDVILKRGSVIIKCDDLTLYSSGSDPDTVTRAVALGTVSFKKEGDRIYSERAEFDLENSRVVLTGKTRFVRGTESISASKIVYNLDSGIASFTGSVDAVISPKPK